MPPKKGTAKAKAPATAAASRPKRTATITEPPAVKKAPTKKAAAKPTTTTAATTATTKTRGRPSKAAEEADVAEPPKKRGRPAKATEDVDVAEPPKKRGRPAAKKEVPAVTEAELPPPKKRGRPPKGGETTKIEADEEAAAEQLEDELVNAVEVEPESSKPKAPAKRGRGRPAKKAGGKTAAAVAVTQDEEAEEDAEGKDVIPQRYWLMKAEQEDREEVLENGKVFNAKFTIDDLRDKHGPEPWDGVRNAVACKNMREMKLGDLAFFYASGGKKPKGPGIVGIMEIVKEHEADSSAFDKDSPYYVTDANRRGSLDKPRWSMVHVEFRKKLSKPVTLVELKTFAEQGRVLAGMQVFTAARLSVSKVSQEEWNFIVEQLIEGYEGDDDDEPLPIVNDGSDVEVTVEIPRTTLSADNELPNGTTVMQSREIPDSDVVTADTALAAETVATSSRPASRAGSRKPSSRTGSVKPGSRAGSLAPPVRASSRGRSRTPKAAAAAAEAVAKAATKAMAAVEEEEEEEEEEAMDLDQDMDAAKELGLA